MNVHGASKLPSTLSFALTRKLASSVVNKLLGMCWHVRLQVMRRVLTEGLAPPDDGREDAGVVRQPCQVQVLEEHGLVVGVTV